MPVISTALLDGYDNGRNQDTSLVWQLVVGLVFAGVDACQHC